jgi:hypothetical protein
MGKQRKISCSFGLNTCMRAQEFNTGIKTYSATIKLRTPGTDPVIDTLVYARTPYLARLLLQHQYGRTCIVSNLREIS